MVKIEALLNNCKATIIRHGSPMPVYLGMLMTKEELSTLKILNGTITYSIEETEVITQHSQQNDPKPEQAVQSTKKIVIPEKVQKLRKQNG